MKGTFITCPVCERKTLHVDLVRNALSRYGDIYICSDCGLREAVEGHFWKWQYRKIMYGI